MGKYSKDKRDIYYRKAKELGFRARSAFKLLQIDEEFNILKGVKRAVDLCAAPGSWSQVLSRKLYSDNTDSSEVKIVAVDLQPMAPIKGVIQIEGDITSQETAEEIINSFDGEKADLVVCDGAPDVTGMHDIDEYIQSQLILSALNITTYLLKKNGKFICKIFRGRDINLLYTKLEIFFNNIAVAKPKSSRNSSIEAFIVCQGYNPPNDYLPNMNILEFNNVANMKQMTENEDNYNKNKFNHKKTILFVACGDLSAYDADSNYPLLDDKQSDDNKNNVNNDGNKTYDYIAPLQPPTNPAYKDFMSLKKNQVFSNKISIVDTNDESDLDEDNIIHAIDAQKGQQNKKGKKQKHIGCESKYDNEEDGRIEYADIETVDSLSVTSIGSPIKRSGREKGGRNRMIKMKNKSKKSQNRNRNRNQIAFYATMAAAAVVVFGLAKFYYQTHQSNDNGAGNNSSGSNVKTTAAIDFRKK